uniref:MOR2-PAG1_C domain-containing protein n=1 Tax=Angiostrongylus cantonensis TaxID=6313 RepID=A0A0K0DLS1_ANGCA
LIYCTALAPTIYVPSLYESIKGATASLEDRRLFLFKFFNHFCLGPRGWGSEEATHLLLNNLMYLTVYLAPDHENEIAELWRALALSFPANLPVILNYLYIVTVLSCDTLLPYAKRISVALAGVVGNRIAPLLLEQLTMSFDSSRLILERFDRAPYYRWKDDIETKKNHHAFRSQVSLLLICDIIRTSSDVDWNEATPRIFHAAVLSLDSLRPALCRHARQIIINISLLHANKDTLAHVSAMLLMHQMCRYTSDDNKFKIPPTSFCDPEGPRGISPTFARVANEEYRNLLLNSNTLFSSQSDLIMALVFCLSENMGNPLWSNEDATPRCWKVPSATQLTCLVRHLAELMLPIIPLLPVVWTQLAMRMALTTTQRHAAGRCFQIVSALCQPPGTWIPSLISRLVETAGETHDETQAYVTDLLLCLISSAPHLNPLLDPPLVSSVSPTHTRSTSYTPALLRQSLLNQRLHQERKDARLSLLLSEDDSSLGVALMRSKSADQLKTEPEGDEEAIARMQICAIAVALLESGVDNEFLLSLNLLEKVLDTSGPHKTRCLQKLEKTVHQLDWKGFNGIVGLLSRGVISCSVVPSAYEPSIQALVRVVDVLDEPVVGGRDSLGIVVCHVLPYLLFNFDSPNHLCVLVCTVLKQVICSCNYTCIYMYIYMYIRIYVYIHSGPYGHYSQGGYLHIYIHVCMHICIYLYTWILGRLVLTGCVSPSIISIFRSFANLAIVVSWSPEVSLTKICPWSSPPQPGSHLLCGSEEDFPPCD